MNRRINVSVESIMVILLMIIFAASITSLIYEGSVTYRNIINNKTEEENTRIALSYVNMRIKQNDVSNHIEITKNGFDGEDLLTIHHHDEEDGLQSFIYYKDGYLWECYTDTLLDHSLSTEVIAIQGINFDFVQDTNTIITTIPFKNNNDYISLSQASSLRSETNR